MPCWDEDGVQLRGDDHDGAGELLVRREEGSPRHGGGGFVAGEWVGSARDARQCVGMVRGWARPVSGPTDTAPLSYGKRSSPRVLRGGSWSGTPRYLRSADRFTLPPEIRRIHLRFSSCQDARRFAGLASCVFMSLPPGGASGRGLLHSGCRRRLFGRDQRSASLRHYHELRRGSPNSRSDSSSICPSNPTMPTCAKPTLRTHGSYVLVLNFAGWHRLAVRSGWNRSHGPQCCRAEAQARPWPQAWPSATRGAPSHLGPCR